MVLILLVDDLQMWLASYTTKLQEEQEPQCKTLLQLRVDEFILGSESW
jgi:hypothetical protein